MVYNCPNELQVKILFNVMLVVVFLVMFLIILIKSVIINNYKDMLVQFEKLKRDLELNTMLKHEHIQNLLCPNDLVDFNNKHIFELNKCSKCNKSCKRDCWKAYFIDKSRSL